ncbi:MAG: lysophospholipid acyltransferase family protein [Gammaproteobacteria bacterium]|nr:lysophospholipid acyltransferase family protein [Gammaproteobacteria bacterium]MCH9744367.1 lysophospholipid acyltransferase family protein [Gammaproteobacteria bacterium]
MSKENTEFLQFKLKFLAPHYWGVWIGFAVLRLLILLPYPMMLALGRKLGSFAGWVLQKINPKRCSVLTTNLKLCFPELSQEKRASIAKQVWQSMGMSVLESAMAWWGSSKKINRLFQVEGMEVIEAAKKKGKGIVLIFNHFATMELVGRWSGENIGLSATAKPIHNLLVHYICQNARKRYCKEILFQKDHKATMAELQSGGAVAFMLDINFNSTKRAVFVPFMGNTASTTIAFSKMARRYDFSYVVGSAFRLPNSQGYRVSIKAAPEGYPSGDNIVDAKQFNEFIEAAVRQYPEQYFWLHRRFKTQPEGIAAPY